MTTYLPLSRIRGRIAEVGVRQADIAAQIGMHETLLNAILRGRRKQPEGFATRVLEALDLLEEANQAAAEARERVLAGGPKSRQESRAG